MRTSLRSVIRLFVALAGVLPGCADQAKDNAAPQARVSEQQQLVDKARLTVLALRSPGGIGDSVNQALDGAWGVLIFYFTGEGSFGLQIGAEAGQVMFVIRNEGALQKIVNGNVNIGADLSVAIGPVGGGVAGATTPNLRSDLVAFSAQQGIFGGIAFKGGVINPLIAWNEAYYGTGATPRAIVIEKRLHNPGADALKAALR
jgi:lipid-binding SYLF domain-containing protein